MKRNALIRAALATLLICGVAATGCGAKNPQGRRAVEGTISIDGTPIATGTIEFAPDASNAVQTTSGAVITDGKFSISETKGLTEGTYSVAVSSRVDTGETVDGPMGPEPVFKDLVPARYGSETQEKATFSGKGPFVYELDIPSERR